MQMVGEMEDSEELAAFSGENCSDKKDGKKRRGTCSCGKGGSDLHVGNDQSTAYILERLGILPGQQQGRLAEYRAAREAEKRKEGRRADEELAKPRGEIEAAVEEWRRRCPVKLWEVRAKRLGG